MSESLPRGRLGAPAESSGDGQAAPKPRRPHRRTGKKPPGGARPNSGGARPGAGRPPGSKNVLPQGYVSAVRVSRMRVPEGASEAEAALADACQQRLIDVMLEEVNPLAAFSVLSAAKALREEVCGKVVDRREVTGKDGAPLEVTIRDLGSEPEGET